MIKSINGLPFEILVSIFCNLDHLTLLGIKSVCKDWCHLIDNSIALWRTLISDHCEKNPAKRHILDLKLYTDIEKRAVNYQRFYRKLNAIESNFVKEKFTVRTLDCLNTSWRGEKVERNFEWESSHNFKGVYDIILQAEYNRLIASVYDTIQVWCLDSFRLCSVLTSATLDRGKIATTSFAARQEALLCGTQHGQIKIFNMLTGELKSCEETSEKQYISDLAVSGDSLVALDWLGHITQWKFISQYKLVMISKSGCGSIKYWEVPRILSTRESERLLDMSPKYAVSTFKCHLTCYEDGEFRRSYPVESDVFCIQIQGDMVAFGCKGDNDTPVAGILQLGNWSSRPRVIYIKTHDNDPVISLSFNKSFLILGDVNGELHIINVENLKFDSVNDARFCTSSDSPCKVSNISFTGTLRTHEYRSFIWAIKSDSYRLLSGDDTGKIIIHDFLMYETSSEA